MAQQLAAARSHLQNIRSNSSNGQATPLHEVQGLINTGAARAFDSLSTIMERRPIRIPQLIETIESTLMIVDVSHFLFRSLISIFDFIIDILSHLLILVNQITFSLWVFLAISLRPEMR